MASRVSLWALLLGFLLIQMEPVFPCDEQAIQQCATNSNFNGIQNFNGIPRTDAFEAACRAFKSFKSCSATLLADCPLSSSDLEEIRAVYSTIEYMCQDQYDAVIKYASCWNKDLVQNGIKHCRTSGTDCSALQKANQCVGNAVREQCGEEAASVMTNILQHTESILISPQTCDFNYVKAFRPEMTSLMFAVVVAVLVTHGDRLGQLLL